MTRKGKKEEEEAEEEKKKKAEGKKGVKKLEGKSDSQDPESAAAPGKVSPATSADDHHETTSDARHLKGVGGKNFKLNHKEFKHIVKASHLGYNKSTWSHNPKQGLYSADQVSAAQKIQRFYKRWKAWEKAAEKREKMLERRMTLVDDLGWLWLFAYNMGGCLLGIFASIALWYFLISDYGLKADTTQNWSLFWLQLCYSALCMLGLFATSPKRLDLLRFYSFLILLFCAAQLSAVGMFAIDQSEATQQLKAQTYFTLVTQGCTIKKEAVEFIEEYSDESNNTNGSWVGEPVAESEAEAATAAFSKAATELCTCSDSCADHNFTMLDDSGSGFLEDDAMLKQCRVDCADVFMGHAKIYLAILFMAIWAVQILSANRAWNFMHDQADKKAIKNGTQLGAGAERLWFQFHTAPQSGGSARIHRARIRLFELADRHS